jgi:hypothetical protein
LHSAAKIIKNQFLIKTFNVNPYLSVIFWRFLSGRAGATRFLIWHKRHQIKRTQTNASSLTRDSEVLMMCKG